MSDLASDWDSIQVQDSQAPKNLADEWDATPTALTKKPFDPSSKASGIASFGAGAGHAVGTGVLGAQQLAGKMLSSVGLNAAGDWLQNDANQGVRKLDTEYAPYKESNPSAGTAGQITGAVFNPINKLVPVAGPTGSIVKDMALGAASGAGMSALTTPVDPSHTFWYDKLQQGGVGALGGAAGAALSNLLASGVGKAAELYRNFGNRSKDIAGDTQKVINEAASQAGLDASKLPQDFSSGLRAQVEDALKSGRPLDRGAVTRIVQANSLPVPVPLTTGQASRDPMKYAMEQNLRGIQGVGEPITDLLQRQNRALIDNLNALGAKDAPNVVDAGKHVLSSLQATDKAVQGKVADAYKAFRDATGKDLDVPLQGLAQDYSRVSSDFGDVIPSAIRKKFESLGLDSGTQLKTFSIQDAEGLIKNINQHYDPSNKAQALALDQLRQSVQKSISEGAGSSANGTQAAALARAARQAAKQRFDLIDQVPLYKAAVVGEAPDKAISKYVLNGNAGDVATTMKLLQQTDPQAVAAVKGSVMDQIKRAALNGSSEDNGIFSQAAYKRIMNDPNNAARLDQIFTPAERTAMRTLGNVAENALMAPKASAVNTLNTASAGANLIKQTVSSGPINKLLSLAGEADIPIVSGGARSALETQRLQRLSELVKSSTSPEISKRVTPAEVQRIADLLHVGGVKLGTAGAGVASRK